MLIAADIFGALLFATNWSQLKFGLSHSIRSDVEPAICYCRLNNKILLALLLLLSKSNSLSYDALYKTMGVRKITRCSL